MDDDIPVTCKVWINAFRGDKRALENLLDKDFVENQIDHKISREEFLTYVVIELQKEFIPKVETVNLFLHTTALWAATYKERTEAVKYLLERGAQKSIKCGKDGKTAEDITQNPTIKNIFSNYK